MTIVITMRSKTEKWSSFNQVITGIYSAYLYDKAEVDEHVSKLNSACRPHVFRRRAGSSTSTAWVPEAQHGPLSGGRPLVTAERH
jgi:hypothetical protein